jgi:glucans biosynthesis protein
MIYGLSARGLAINTGDSMGEEFPTFRHFWIEQPAHGARSVVVRALLDSESCTGAFEFDITPGETTVMQTRCTLFPRDVLEQVGVAPLTSMFVFGPQWRPGVDDFRSAVHDSEGLHMITGRTERLWRPLTNPRQLQISAFQDAGPKAFGLGQRRREFSHYQDDEARYELRPTAWIEPIEDWGAGAVVLVEIPTTYEFNDNIVAFWRPAQPLGPTEQGHQFAYRLHWCATPPDQAPVARVHATRAGSSIHDENRRVIVVDFATQERWTEPPTIEANISHGEITGLTLRELPGGDITRVSFEFSPGEEEVIELRLALLGPNGPVSERWTYRWTPA